MGNDEGQKWIERYLANTLTKEYQINISPAQIISYKEIMSEIKLCPSVALQYLQLCKTDDARFETIHMYYNTQYKNYNFKLPEKIFLGFIRHFKTFFTNISSLTRCHSKSKIV